MVLLNEGDGFDRIKAAMEFSFQDLSPEEKEAFIQRGARVLLETITGEIIPHTAEEIIDQEAVARKATDALKRYLNAGRDS